MSVPAVATWSATIHEFTTDLAVRRRTDAADGVVLLDLADPYDQDLPGWEPGAHVDLLLPDGLTRQYSLCGDPRDPWVWRVGVLFDPSSRGGSRYVHESLYEGATVRVRGPRNHFPLVDSPRYRFIAGGIGITPILTMISAAERAGAEWTLLYGGRTRASMAFAAELAARYPEQVTIWPQDEHGMLVLGPVLGTPQADTLVYCCGPDGLLTAVEKECGQWPAGALHVERFAAKTPTDVNQGLEEFEVVCQRSGVAVHVGAGESILDVLERSDVPIMASCYEGVCGTCEARVIDGTPDHRDSVLTEPERAANEVMLVCVSRSRTEKLVLDL